MESNKEAHHLHPFEIEQRAESSRLKDALRHEKQNARRWHCLATAAIDVIWKEMVQTLSTTVLDEQAAVIEYYRGEFEPYLRPQTKPPS